MDLRALETLLRDETLAPRCETETRSWCGESISRVRVVLEGRITLGEHLEICRIMRSIQGTLEEGDPVAARPQPLAQSE